MTSSSLEPDKTINMTSSPRSATALLVLAGLGLIGNVLHIPLFFGVDFLTGNLFVFLALALFGTAAGAGVAAVAGAYTYFLWGHPYAWAGMVIQALLVGAAIRYRRDAAPPRNIPDWVVLYWLLVGLPLIANLYHYAIGLDWQGALMVALKQAVNDMFNALMAALALHYLPVRRWARLRADDSGHSLRYLQSNLLAGFAFFPALVVITLASRAEVANVEGAINARLATRSTAMSLDLREWIDEHMQTAQGLARQVGQVQSLTAGELHRDLRFFAAASPAVAAVRIIDASGQVVSSSDSPPGVKGADLSDREWFGRLREYRTPVIALIPKGRMLPEPLVVFVAPLLQGTGENASLRGGLVLTYKVRSFQNMFSADVLEDSMRATLLGRNDNVIVSSEPRFAPGGHFGKQRGGSVIKGAGEVYRWQPEESMPAMQAWAASYYVRHVTLGDSGSVRIQVRPEGAERLRILVTDTGPGISRDRQKELFQPFNRLGVENSTIEGTGIGLTIVRSIVEAMGGAVGVESEVGVGSTFWIELPRDALAPAPSDAVSAAARGASQSKGADDSDGKIVEHRKTAQ
jgi:uncharacterized membrane protein